MESSARHPALEVYQKMLLQVSGQPSAQGASSIDVDVDRSGAAPTTQAALGDKFTVYDTTQSSHASSSRASGAGAGDAGAGGDPPIDLHARLNPTYIDPKCVHSQGRPKSSLRSKASRI